MPNLPSTPLIRGIIAHAEKLDAETPGSGNTWLEEIREREVLGLLDSDDALLTATGINGKNDSFFIEMGRKERLRAIDHAISCRADELPGGGSRIQFADFGKTKF